MRDIKDYLPLYMGQKIIFPERGANQARVFTVTGSIYDSMGTDKDFHKHEKRCLILRPLSDMTEEEAIEIADILGGASHLSRDSKIHAARELANRMLYTQTNIWGINWMRLTVHLLSKGFDLFGLIDDQLAIDSTTLKLSNASI
jgi:hypothetical protein